MAFRQFKTKWAELETIVNRFELKVLNTPTDNVFVRYGQDHAVGLFLMVFADVEDDEVVLVDVDQMFSQRLNMERVFREIERLDPFDDDWPCSGCGQVSCVCGCSDAPVSVCWA